VAADIVSVNKRKLVVAVRLLVVWTKKTEQKECWRRVCCKENTGVLTSDQVENLQLWKPKKSVVQCWKIELVVVV